LKRLLDESLAGRPSVARISTLGLLGGVELRDVSHPWASWSSLGLPELEGRPVSGALVVQRLAARRRIITELCGHDWSVVRIEPPLTVSEQDCRDFVLAFSEAVDWLEKNG
jgi:4-aminobutyrate aminotransferase-like enzyme